jgi:predicted Co/Zn/Cd cation transporter (cation efflux family)
MTTSNAELDFARRRALTSAVVSFALMGVILGLHFHEILMQTQAILWFALMASAVCLMIYSEQARNAKRVHRPLRRLPPAPDDGGGWRRSIS